MASCYKCCLLPPPPPATLLGLTVVHGHRVDGGHRLWVASRVTVARLWVGRVGRVPSRQDRWLPVAPLGWRARVQRVAVLIRRRGTGVRHGLSSAEGRPQLLGPEMGDEKSSHECPDPAQPQARLPLLRGDLSDPSLPSTAHRPSCPSPQQLSPCPPPSR